LKLYEKFPKPSGVVATTGPVAVVTPFVSLTHLTNRALGSLDWPVKPITVF
jgi:hypothetical protein